MNIVNEYAVMIFKKEYNGKVYGVRQEGLFTFDGYNLTETILPRSTGNNGGVDIIYEHLVYWGDYNLFRYENPRATLTFLAGNVLSADTSVSGTGWENFPIRSTLNNTLLFKFGSDLRNAIKDVSKISDGGYNNPVLVRTSDKLWLPSYEELGATGQDAYIIPGQGEAYSVFTDDTSRVRTETNGNGANYFTRTSQIGGANRVVAIANSGAGSYGGAGWTHYKFVIGFCI